MVKPKAQNMNTSMYTSSSFFKEPWISIVESFYVCPPSERHKKPTALTHTGYFGNMKTFHSHHGGLIVQHFNICHAS